MVLNRNNAVDASQYRSPEYQAAVAHRLRAAQYQTLTIDGEVNLPAKA
jgi:uncharacterized protein (DUF1330 family)